MERTAAAPPRLARAPPKHDEAFWGERHLGRAGRAGGGRGRGGEGVAFGNRASGRPRTQPNRRASAAGRGVRGAGGGGAANGADAADGRNVAHADRAHVRRGRRAAAVPGPRLTACCCCLGVHCAARGRGGRQRVRARRESGAFKAGSGWVGRTRGGPRSARRHASRTDSGRRGGRGPLGAASALGHANAGGRAGSGGRSGRLRGGGADADRGPACASASASCPGSRAHWSDRGS